MKPPLTLLVVAVLGLGLLACGGASTRSGSATATSGAPTAKLPQIEVKADNDMDSDAYWDGPDNESEAFGPPANAADARAVTALVERYYAVARAGDGASACRLLYRVFAESVPEDYGSAPAQPGLDYRSCAAVLSKLYRVSHRRLSVEDTGLRVSAVRVNLNRAAAQLNWAEKGPSHYIMVHRERGAWKIAMLYGTDQPIVME